MSFITGYLLGFVIFSILGFLIGWLSDIRIPKISIRKFSSYIFERENKDDLSSKD